MFLSNILHSDLLDDRPIGIFMGAISALTRKRSVWYVGLDIAAIIVPIGYANGIGFMVAGTFPSPEPAISTK